MFWADWIGNIANVVRKVVLLFRYEIQDALETSKAESGIISLDERNIFVRYRQILRPRSQNWLMLLLVAFTGIPNILAAAILNEEASEPCTTDIISENYLLLTLILISYILYFIPMMGCSVWSTRRLKKFPNDNWKMGEESTYTSLMAIVAGICCISTLIAVPTFDGLLFVLFSFSIVMQSLNFLMPLQLHRRTVGQLAHMDISKLTSLHRLLQDADFLAGFDSFLRKEFSSENLFFWQSVHKLRQKYKPLLPEGMNSEESGFSSAPSLGMSISGLSTTSPSEIHCKLLVDAAEECRRLGKQCIGDSAPWQINISGFTEQDMEKAIRDVDEIIVSDGSAKGENALRVVVEEALKTLVVAQREVYEGLRKDSYPRFLMSAAAKELNKNENLKRLLASEKLESDVQKTHTQSGHRTKSSSRHSSSEKSKKEKDKGRLSYDVVLPQLKTFVLANASIAEDQPSRGSKSHYGGSSSDENAEDRESNMEEADVEIEVPFASVPMSCSSSSSQ